jgi:hypothetical protein
MIKFWVPVVLFFALSLSAMAASCEVQLDHGVEVNNLTISDDQVHLTYTMPGWNYPRSLNFNYALDFTFDIFDFYKATTPMDSSVVWMEFTSEINRGEKIYYMNLCLRPEWDDGTENARYLTWQIIRCK